MKKKLLLASVALLAVFGTSFAYFTDTVNTSTKGTAGVVQLGAVTSIPEKTLMVPGDTYAVNLSTKNVSTVPVNARVKLEITSDHAYPTDITGQGFALLDDKGAFIPFVEKKATLDLGKVEPTVKDIKKALTLKLLETSGNNFQSKDVTIKATVEIIQSGNIVDTAGKWTATAGGTEIVIVAK